MGSSYRAFISYSHADSRQAKQLHARLESYRLPKSLGNIGSTFRPNARLGPIFRDRDDLPASQDLSDAVRTALAGSDVLVVICSPAARASHWVAREIELFRQLHPDGQILAAIIEGNPQEAIPEALLAMGEPAAADLRKGSDGRKLGFLKVVAGIAGVPLDALAQRDAQRRLRRVTAITLMALAAMVAMAIMTYLAIQSRNEAERQRAEAEGLVEFMLTDLREELRGVGRLDVMDGVNDRVMDYYAQQDDTVLERRARALHAMGEDELARTDADLERALGLFEEALETTQALLDRDPDSPQRVFDHAQSQYWVGYAYEMTGDFGNAAPWYRAYRDGAMRLAEIEPGTLRTELEIAYSESNLGILALSGEQEDAAKAATHFEAAIGGFAAASELAPQDEENREQLANGWSYLGRAHFTAGDYSASSEAQRHALSIKQEMAEADPANLDKRYALLLERRALALSQLALGNRAYAASELADLANASGELSARDPQNNGWLELATKVRNELEELNNRVEM